MELLTAALDTLHGGNYGMLQPPLKVPYLNNTYFERQAKAELTAAVRLITVLLK